MYAFAPITLAALHKRDPDRYRPYRMPWPKVLNPVGFCLASLIIYWSGFEVMWKLLAMILVGRVLFEIALRRADPKRTDVDFRASSWIWPWLIGNTVIAVLGRYGGKNVLPDWIDIIVVVVYSLIIFYYAVAFSRPTAQVYEAIGSEDWQLPTSPEVRLT
jgi:amino acid transporter